MSIFRKSLTATIELQDLYIVPSGMESSIISIIVSELNGINKTTIFKIYDKFNIERTTLQIFTNGNQTETFNSKIFLESGDIIKAKTTEGTTSIIISGAEDIVINQNINNNFEYCGIYNNNNIYIKDNVVQLNRNLYIAKQEVPTNNAPPNIYWDLFLEKSIDIEPGTILTFSFNNIPDGWLKCNGAEISRSIYNNLFNRINTIYGEGDGLTTFNLPDLRGIFVRGFDDGKNIDTDRIFGSYQEDDIKSHRHYIELYKGGWDKSPRYNHWFNSGSRGRGYGGRNTDYFGNDETRPKNISMLYCIKY